MPRFYVEKDGEWNIFSTIIDDFIFDEFVCLDVLKARLLYERYKELTEDIDSLLINRPRVNVMPYSDAMERIRKTESNSEKPNNCEELNAYRECVKSRSFWDSKHCDGCYFDERCPFDEPMDEQQTDTEIAKAIVHKMIDNSDIAEDAYPNLRQRMHEAVERLDEYYPSEHERSE